MARHKKMQPPEEDEPGLDISSLIDVCFLLLIYFLVTTQIVKKEQELSTSLPSTSPSTTPPDIAPLLILLEGNGNISLKDETGNIQLMESNSSVRELPNLGKRLDLHKSVAETSSQKALVQIRVAGDAVQQRVIDVLNALAGAKITEITFTDINDPDA